MNRKRVLIVDDDNGVLEVICLILETMTPWEIITASSGKQAIALLENQPIDAIIMDMMMPELDGIETLKRIQANDKNKALPAILLTAKNMLNKKEDLATISYIGIINKPFKGSELVKQLDLLLNWNH